MKTSSVRVVKQIKAPADAVWQTISAIGGVDQWLSMIASCRFEGSGPGARRICTTADGATLDERIEEIDPHNKIFRYSVPQPPLPFKNLLGRMQVIPTGDGETAVDWSATFEVEPTQEAEISGLLEGIYTEGIRGLEKLHT